MFCAVMALAFMTAPVASASPNLAGKTVQLTIPSGPGSGFDAWGRTVAHNIGRHLPGDPTVVPQNMPGAGGFTAANYIYNIAPKDGTALGLIQSATALAQMTGMPGARFDATKITWLGTTTTEIHICAAYNSPNLKVHSVKDLYTNELTVGTTGAGSASDLEPKALNALLGLKFKTIAGYQSSGETFLAMERGEIESICINYSGLVLLKPDWVRDGKLIILTQSAPSLKDVPYVNDLAKTPEDAQALNFLYTNGSIGRPFVAPPDLAPDVSTMLREAFDATMKDPEFIAEVQKQNLDLNPRNGDYLDSVIARAYATPKPIIEKILNLAK
jgi:tripartite-type tricarboxylate transporter receptor subunit TctC